MPCFVWHVIMFMSYFIFLLLSHSQIHNSPKSSEVVSKRYFYHSLFPYIRSFCPTCVCSSTSRCRTSRRHGCVCYRGTGAGTGTSFCEATRWLPCLSRIRSTSSWLLTDRASHHGPLLEVSILLRSYWIFSSHPLFYRRLFHRTIFMHLSSSLQTSSPYSSTWFPIFYTLSYLI